MKGIVSLKRMRPKKLFGNHLVWVVCDLAICRSLSNHFEPQFFYARAYWFQFRYRNIDYRIAALGTLPTRLPCPSVELLIPLKLYDDQRIVR
jgi:hypothetical protein